MAKKKKRKKGKNTQRKNGLSLYELIEYESTRNYSQIRSRSKDFQKRAKKFGSVVDGTVTITILRLFYGSLTCRYCGELNHVTVDHLVPLSRGGAHSIHNIVMACADCNGKKGNKTIIEFLIEQKAL